MTYQDVCRVHDAQSLASQHNSTPASNPSAQSSESAVDLFSSEKVKRFCKVAAEHGYKYAWTDACCIDQTSSSELSEAINSMYDWYRYADVCYVYLYDVPTAPTVELETPDSIFQVSRWHRRGWTLQELLAPRTVVFLSNTWETLGTKHTLAHLVHAATGIDRAILTGERALEEFSVACRLSWASKRETTREEDEAYSLMGIFGVHMPTTYGEGRYAFIRLQEEIVKRIPDQTIFAWGPIVSHHHFTFDSLPPRPSSHQMWTTPSLDISSLNQFLLASSPRDFLGCSCLVSIPWDKFTRKLKVQFGHRPTYVTTPYGVRTRLPLLAVRATDPHTNGPTRVALLACQDVTNGKILTLLLRSQPRRAEGDYFVGGAVGQLGDLAGAFDTDTSSTTPANALSEHYFRMASIPLDTLQALASRWHQPESYIPYWPSSASYNLQRDVHLHTALRSASVNWTFDLNIAAWSQDLLKSCGYSIRKSTSRDPYTIDLVDSSSSSEYITICVQRCACEFGVKYRYISVTVLLDGPDRSWPVRRPAPHRLDDDSHVRASWTFRDGTASKEFHLWPNTRKNITVRLSLTRSATFSPSYTLGVELWATTSKMGFILPSDPSLTTTPTCTGPSIPTHSNASQRSSRSWKKRVVPHDADADVLSWDDPAPVEIDMMEFEISARTPSPTGTSQLYHATDLASPRILSPAPGPVTFEAPHSPTRHTRRSSSTPARSTSPGSLSPATISRNSAPPTSGISCAMLDGQPEGHSAEHPSIRRRR